MNFSWLNEDYKPPFKEEMWRPYGHINGHFITTRYRFDSYEGEWYSIEEWVSGDFKEETAYEEKLTCHYCDSTLDIDIEISRKHYPEIHVETSWFYVGYFNSFECKTLRDDEVESKHMEMYLDDGRVSVREK